MLRRAISVLFCAFVAGASFASLRAASFVGRPFPGFLIYPNNVVSAFGSDRWPGVRAGLDAWDVVREVDGRPVARAGEVFEIVGRRPVGAPITYTIRRGGETLQVTVPSIRFTRRDFVIEPLPFLATGVAFALAALAAWLARPGAAAFGFAAFGLAIAASMLRIDLYAEGALACALQPVLPLVAAALCHLALVFPRRPLWLARRPSWLLVPYAAAAALGLARALVLFRAVDVWIRLDQVAFLYCGLATIALLAAPLYWAVNAPEPSARERARVVLWGLVPAVLLTGAGGLIRSLAGSRAAISFLPLAGAWVWIGSLGYAAVKHNIFEFEIFVRRTVTLTVIWAVTAAAYGAGALVSYGALRAVGYSNQMLLPLLGVLFAIPLIPGLASAMQRRVEARLFPLRVRLVEVVRDLSEELSTLMASEELSQKVRSTFVGRVGVGRAVIYVCAAGELSALGAGAPAPGPEIEPLLRKLERGEAVSIFALSGGRFRPALEWMRHQSFTLLLPLIARSGLEGFLALGEPPGGRVFNSEDIDTLAALASRIAISLANAHAIDRIRDLEQRLHDENLALREELELHPGFPEIVGRSPKMLAIFRTIEQVAPTGATVLILGETGTGKELVARALHVRSPRREGPLVKVNCAAIPSGLIESELFGHERGAFTGAFGRRRGKFELAQRGTIFLDEIGELTLDVQAKILRVLQEREFERVGGTETLHADVRVIAASNRDLRAEVAAGRFREDLFFRLNVFPIRLPPLRERPEDVPLLVEHFLLRFNVRLHRQVIGLSERSRAEVQRYDWPGNVRELENLIERAMILSEDDRITLPGLDVASFARERETPPLGPLSEILRAAKAAAIDRALAAGGSQARAAELLGLKPPSLSRMLRDLGMR